MLFFDFCKSPITGQGQTTGDQRGITSDTFCSFTLIFFILQLEEKMRRFEETLAATIQTEKNVAAMLAFAEQMEEKLTTAQENLRIPIQHRDTAEESSRNSVTANQRCHDATETAQAAKRIAQRTLTTVQAAERTNTYCVHDRKKLARETSHCSNSKRLKQYLKWHAKSDKMTKMSGSDYTV